MAEFEGVPSYGKIEYKVMEGTSRTLEIAIPAVEMSSGQAKVFEQMTNYAKEKGVNIVVRIIK